MTDIIDRRADCIGHLVEDGYRKRESICWVFGACNYTYAVRSFLPDNYIHPIAGRGSSYRYASNTSAGSLGYDRKWVVFVIDLPLEQLSYPARRKPAWTDRILHMSAPGVPVTQRSYCSHPQITMSDHRPVSADFDLNVCFCLQCHIDSFMLNVCQVSIVDKQRREIAASKLYRELWGVEHSSKPPKIKLQSMTLDFGKV